MMKQTTWILGIALAGLVALASTGCKKEAPVQRVTTYNKVAVDMPKLRKSLEGSAPEVLIALRNITMRLRYGQYVDALMGLDKLKANPAVNDASKQIINDVMEQVKQAAENQQAARAAKAGK
jgi:hypothetical protein